MRVKRVTVPPPPDDDEVFAKVRIFPGDDVSDLAARVVAAFPRWGVADAGQVRLFLAAAGGEDEPSAAAEAGALAAASPRRSPLSASSAFRELARPRLRRRCLPRC